MSWVLIDDAIFDHPKILAVGPHAALLHLAAIVWSARNLTDGFVPDAKVGTLVNWDDAAEYEPLESDKPGGLVSASRVQPYDLANALVAVRLWQETDDGYRIHDYLEYQRSREQILASRARDRVRKGCGPNGIRAESSRIPAAPNPNPTRDVPSPDVLPGISGRSEARSTVGKGKHGAPRRAPATLWPDDFKLTEERRDVARAFGIDPATEWAKFKDSALAHGRRYANWDAAWRSWCRNAESFAGRGGNAAR